MDYVWIFGDLNYVNKDNIEALKEDREEVERMLISADKIIGVQPLEQTLGHLAP